jgi:hypothetical protein
MDVMRERKIERVTENPMRIMLPAMLLLMLSQLLRCFLPRRC